ncbi:8340_t:CDS:2 [Entrophospora sp. SA101]|nr:6933_t:CDS:2 [Entrophospora sp. SA101]CAJ0897467.1 8340_t:CDS:2 [Entrophospora sp. SA101]
MAKPHLQCLRTLLHQTHHQGVYFDGHEREDVDEEDISDLVEAFKPRNTPKVENFLWEIFPTPRHHLEQKK